MKSTRTATDFCSAIREGSVRISAGAGTELASAYVIINEWVADLYTFEPASLHAPVDGLTTALSDVSKNPRLGVLATNDDFSAALQAALTTPDGRTSAYSLASCPKP